MDAIDDQQLKDYLASVPQSDIAPEHRAWMNAQIRAALEKIEAGEMSYLSLDDVMREFGFNAR